ncbi:MAG: nickel transporter, partial [Candidatus Nanopelagicales bacterium]
MTWARRVGVIASVAGAVALLPSVAFAHPLGNATVNRADVIIASTDHISITHILDLAEIPTVQAMPRLDSDSNETVSASEMTAYADSTCRADADSSELRVGGQRATLSVTGSSGELLAGQAGLQTLRISCDWRTPIDLTS